MRLLALSSLVLSGLAADLAAQAVVSVDSVAVVTTDGFFVPSTTSATPRLFAPASAFGGLSALQSPTVEWEPNLTGAPADSFLVTTRTGLYRVTVTGLNPAPSYTVTDLTPSGSPDLLGLDLNPGTGELYLLDAATDSALRFAPPFSLGMSAVQSIPVPSGARSIAFDSRTVPPAVIAMTSNSVERVPLDGSASSTVVFTSGAGGLDVDPQQSGNAGVYLTVQGNNIIGRATSSPNLIISMNVSGQCVPVALAPTDVEWHPLKNRAYALAADGLNPFCGGALSAVGDNHVVKFPVAGGPVSPTLYTNASGSGITGDDGDLAIVFDDFGTITSIGEACGGGVAPRLDASVPYVSPSTASLDLTIDGATANAPTYLTLGASQISVTLPSGCVLVASPDIYTFVGNTNGAGSLTVPLTVAALPAGLDVYVQGIVLIPGGKTVSQGLKFHIGV